MPKPILLAIDDDTSVLEAVVQDLRRHYGQDYRDCPGSVTRVGPHWIFAVQLKERSEDRSTVSIRPAYARYDGRGFLCSMLALTIYPERRSACC